MYQIVRLYINVNGVEKCIQDPDQMIRTLLESTEPIDLDYHDKRGYAHMGSSSTFAGKTVLVGEKEILIPSKD
jgi:hypothetical protein